MTPTQLLALASAAPEGPWNAAGWAIEKRGKRSSRRIACITADIGASGEHPLCKYIAACSPSLIKPLAELWRAAEELAAYKPLERPFTDLQAHEHFTKPWEALNAALLALSSMGKGE